MAPLSALEKAEKDRASVLVQVEYLLLKVADHLVNPIPLITVDLYLTLVENSSNKLQTCYEKILNQTIADMDPYNLAHFAVLDKVIEAQTELQAIKASYFPVIPVPVIPGGTPATAEIRLPRLILPTFDGQIQSWISFHDMFCAAVHNNTKLTKAQKLTYLKSALIGEAARQVSSLAVTDDNYDTAWTQLADRYQNNRELMFAVMRKFTGQPILPGNSAVALRTLIDVSKECIHSLEQLQLEVDKWDAVILFHMSTKLDNPTRELWEQSLTTSEIPPLKTFLDFLEQRARALAAGGNPPVKSGLGAQGNPKGKSGQGVYGGNPAVPNQRQAAHSHHIPGSSSCIVCSGNHFLYICPTFLAMLFPERFEVAKKHSLCFNCLKNGHSTGKCPSKYVCRTCSGKHHTLLHRPKSPGTTPNPETPELVLGHHSNNNSWQSRGMLATAIIKIRDHQGKYQLIRAFLDGGSTASFITESCVRKLGLNRHRICAEILGLASKAVGVAKGFTNLQFTAHFPGNITHAVDALILPKVTARLPIHECDPSSWPHLKGLLLADPNFHIPDHIDVLLGADVFYNTFLNETRLGPPGCPNAVKTTLGWIVAGEYKTNSTKVIVNYGDLDMEKQLHRLWEIDTVSTTRSMTKEELECEAHFQSTNHINEQGRFVLRLPLRNPQPVLGHSRELAVRQLKQLEGRLARDPARYEQYKEFMQEYLDLGHMEKIPCSEVPVSQVCYIPHHFVLKESSTTTKLRVVFNASFKTTTGVSLNDALMVGPTIQDNMTDILMRFRRHPIAFTADVAKMYRQILVSHPDNDLQRIVWRNSPDEPIQDYRLLTVTYGTGPAPFLATRVLQQLAMNHEEALPLAFHAAMKDMYVDDLLSGSPSLPSAFETVQQLMKLMELGGMELRKWATNCTSLLEIIPLEMRETQPLLPLNIEDSDQTIKALGVFWDPVLDTCRFKVRLDLTVLGHQLTKRNVLSQISTIFDPLGWLAPVIIKGRILIQQLWKLQLGWDDPLPLSVQMEWLNLRNGLYHLEDLSIPRCMIPAGYSRIKLAGFSDASEKAYSAVVYLCVFEDGQPPVISQVASKTRVAPAKTVSLPRLELCGAVLLSQLIKTVQLNLDVPLSQTTAWTDSTIVLGWIKAHPSRWKTFVANRVTEIQERIPACHWAHVSGEENPADCASRGLDPIELKTHSLWWTGPTWLLTEGSGIISLDISEDDQLAMNSEERHVTVCAHTLTQENSLLRKYSSLWRLQRVTAYIFRFYTNCLIKVQTRKSLFPCLVAQTGPLTPVEIDAALLTWVQIVQAEQFSREIKDLQQELRIHPKSSVQALNPFMDSRNILRVGGRLRHSQLPINQREPILLPRHHYFTKLLIMSEHRKNLHAGPQLLLSIIHQRFWIVRARDAIRHEIKKCVVCTRMTATTLDQFMGDYPAARVIPARAFLKCGVDYAGPFLLKSISPRSKISIKSYFAIFVCFTTHAIHLELVSSLTTAAFLAALHRFVSRRGKPSDMYSDCGTNFIGAAKEIQQATALLNSSSHNQQVADSLASEGIHWHFNPPGAPHFGGLWEAGVKSVKFHLKRVIGLTRLTFEEFSTVLTQVEGCLNSRPLTPISTSPDDFTALTPGHFLIGSPLTALPEADVTDLNTGRLSRWQHVQQVHQHFWKRWSNEFIARLQQRPKWLKHRVDIRVNDMVIIKDDRLPPLKWQLGRVVQVHPGPDGLIRLVTVRTATGEIKRPIVKLCLLPIDPATTNPELATQSTMSIVPE